MTIDQADHRTNEQYQQFAARIRRYCDAQDRSRADVVQKLKSWNCEPEWIGSLKSELIEQGYVDDARFAKSFARGKFRIKSWGRLKIIAALYQHNVPAAVINEALSEINEDEYKKTLKDILEKKWKITSGDKNTRTNKTASFAIGKGFESSLVFELIQTLKQ